MTNQILTPTALDNKLVVNLLDRLIVLFLLLLLLLQITSCGGGSGSGGTNNIGESGGNSPHTFDTSGLTNKTISVSTSSDPYGVDFKIERDRVGDELWRRNLLGHDMGIRVDRDGSFIPELPDDSYQRVGLGQYGFSDTYQEYSTSNRYFIIYDIYSYLNLSENSEESEVLVDAFIYGDSSNSWDTMRWEINAFGTGLQSLPTGNQIYDGITISLPKTNHDGRKDHGGLSYRRFFMSVDFSSGVANINPKTQPTLGINQVDLVGNFTVNLRDGTFGVGNNDSLMLKIGTDSGVEYSTASLYGTFHGPEGEGVTGVFHETDNKPIFIGTILGAKEGLINSFPNR